VPVRRRITSTEAGGGQEIEEQPARPALRPGTAGR